LRQAPSLPKPGAGLHDSIMRAVHASAPAAPRVSRAFVWWVPVAAAASLAALAVWWQFRAPAPSAPPMPNEIASAPGDALDLGAQAPALLMAPLSNELARVDHDLHHATEAMLASFP
jgi:hypothetical protein